MLITKDFNPTKRFKPNKAFRHDYNKLFKEDPGEANLFLLMVELADKNGQIAIDNPFFEVLAVLMHKRFKDPTAYQL